MFVAPDFKALRGMAPAAMTIIDMPIGLADAGRRACEAMTRQKIGPRRSSVFSAPRRPMLAFSDYAQANEWGKRQGKALGGGLSKQAWMIVPKIRDIDAVITPADQDYVGEGHPELAFWRLNGGAPCRRPKREKEGAEERRALLDRAGIADAAAHFDALRKRYGRGVALDDVYDACVLALTAEARLNGEAVRLSDGARDARGLVMEIWG